MLWISCEQTNTATAFLRTIVRTLSTELELSHIPQEDADSTFADYLDRLTVPRAAVVVAFDNLGTIFDVDRKIVQAILQAVVSKASLVVTMRGQRRPSIGRIWSWPGSASELEQLPQEAWLPAFSAHAGVYVEPSESLNTILRRVNGYPLAIRLLGQSVADGNYTSNQHSVAITTESKRTYCDSHIIRSHDRLIGLGMVRMPNIERRWDERRWRAVGHTVRKRVRSVSELADGQVGAVDGLHGTDPCAGRLEAAGLDDRLPCRRGSFIAFGRACVYT